MRWVVGEPGTRLELIDLEGNESSLFIQWDDEETPGPVWKFRRGEESLRPDWYRKLNRTAHILVETLDYISW